MSISPVVAMTSEEAIAQLQSLVDLMDEPMKNTFHNIHNGYPSEALERFLKAREWNVSKAHQMLTDSLRWRIINDVDGILSKPIVPVEVYRAVRDSHLVGLSGYTKQGLPVIAVGVGLSTYNKAPVHHYMQSHIQMNEYRDRVILPAASRKHGRHIARCVKVMDMTGLKLSALNQIQLLTHMTTIDDLNYPERTESYYIVNAPYVFSACWKVVKPLLHDRTRRKVHVLQGYGERELLKVMEYSSLPHFCRRGDPANAVSCYSLDHSFHQQLYSFVKQQALLKR